MKFTLGLLSALLAFSGAINTAIAAKKEDNIEKKGFNELKVINRTNYNFNVKVQDKKTPATSGMGKFVKAQKDEPITARDETLPIAYEGSNYWIELEGGQRAQEDDFKWDGPKDYKYPFTTISGGLPKVVTIEVKYSHDNNKAEMTLEEKPN